MIVYYVLLYWFAEIFHHTSRASFKWYMYMIVHICVEVVLKWRFARNTPGKYTISSTNPIAILYHYLTLM